MKNIFGLMVFGLVVCEMSLGIAPVYARSLAKVNERDISDKDMTMALSGFNEDQRRNILKDPNTRREILDSMIDQEVMLQEGEKLKLDQDPEFKEITAAFRKQLIVNRLLQKKLSNQVTQSVMKKYYETHKDKFSTDQVHVQHILLSTEDEAKKILATVKAGSSDFQSLAEKYSKDPSAKNNRGDLGFIGRDRMVPEFMDVVFATKDGEIKGPIKTGFGYHIIKVLAKKFGKPLEFGEVELRVRDSVQRDLTRAYADTLRKQAKISVDRAILDKM